MDRVISPYLSVLEQIKWQDVNDFSFPEGCVKQWLTEQGSLSELMKCHCMHLSVDVLQSTWLADDHLSRNESQLLNHPERFLLRQVILSGDSSPWIIGHTLFPEETFLHSGCDFSSQESLPIGELIFGMPDVRRDALQVAFIHSEQSKLWARRSRVWVNENPMLITELFLPESPIYEQET